MNEHHTKYARPGPVLLRAVTVLAMLISQFSTVHVAYAQDSSGEAGNRIFLPVVTNSGGAAVVEQAETQDTTEEQDSAPAESGEVQAAAGGAYTLNFAAADPADYIPTIPFPSDLTAPIGRADGDPLIPLAEFNDGTSRLSERMHTIYGQFHSELFVYSMSIDDRPCYTRQIANDRFA